MTATRGHLQCPFCHSYEIDRLYVATARLDSCACLACGARWNEDPVTGEFRGRSSSSVLVPPE